jgi:hypothetical protein
MIYTDKNRRDVNGSQRETSICTINESIINFKGYQNFTIMNDSVVTTCPKIKNQFNFLKDIDYSDSDTIIDVGCSNGFFAFWYLTTYPEKQITFMDHDKECINNIQRVLKKLDKPNYTIVNQNFNRFIENDIKYDTILMLSIIHWLYSCTTTICCLNDILKNVRNKNNKQLVIEWVDNDDNAIKSFNHISYNFREHKSPYNLETFLKALKSLYNNVELLGYTNREHTRSIYICTV